MSFENKSLEIESYLADSEEKEKQWLEQDDTVKAEESKSPNVQLPVPLSSSLPKTSESNEIQRDLQKLPTGKPGPTANSNQRSHIIISIICLTASKTERKGSRFSDGKALVYNVASSQLLNLTLPSPSIRQSNLEHRPPVTDSKKHDSVRKDDYSDDSESSRKRSKHSTTSSKSSHHRSKRDYSRSPSSRKHKKPRRRSSSSSSDRSSYSRHSDRSRKHSRRERSSSDDRTSRSSQGSHKRDKHSRDKSYSRSHSYKKSRR